MKMLKDFILKLQNSDEAVKKFWLVVLSGATMAVVIGLWVVYLDFTIAKIGTPANSPVIAKNEEIEGGPGFFAIFGAGVKTIYDQIKIKLSVKNSIVIENQERNFVAENVEPIKPSKLR